jgi:hypothetical protein
MGLLITGMAWVEEGLEKLGYFFFPHLDMKKKKKKERRRSVLGF